ncbi:MAG: hypothetical protein DMG58_06690 [Acidobacteria bacterium]|nr:MAG: hypothetical protein DMG58_06690 [Acidobacteriota bacterium]
MTRRGKIFMKRAESLSVFAAIIGLSVAWNHPQNAKFYAGGYVVASLSSAMDSEALKVRSVQVH